uniref:Uncharacterized protein n=1 Tax=Aegilops tauschii subsp. strangulata TaxID=200361 RepID=A0A453SIL2_AEGTS
MSRPEGGRRLSARSKSAQMLCQSLLISKPHDVGHFTILVTDTGEINLQVTSRKDQPQYWARNDRRYQYVPVKEFARAFQAFHVGQSLAAELSRPFDRSQCHPASLTTKPYGASKMELLRACVEREWLLMKRNMFVYRFRAFQVKPPISVQAYLHTYKRLID